MPAIYSPEMAMAGFGMLGDIVPAINYVARLDGATQYWQLSEDKSLVGDFEVSFDVLIGGTSPYILLGGDSSYGCIFFASGKFNFRDLNGVTRETQNTFGTIGDVVHSLRVVVDEGVLSVFINDVQEPLSGDASNFTGLFLKYLATRNAGEFELEGYIKNFKLVESGATTVEIPLTNKAQGATQLATVGNVNATLVNYTEAVWEEV